MAQTGCTEEKAKEALAAENGDLINASECQERPCRLRKRRAVGDLRARPEHELTFHSHAHWLLKHRCETGKRRVSRTTQRAQRVIVDLHWSHASMRER